MEQIDDDVVRQIAHQLELVLFPAEDRLFQQNFVDGREVEAASEEFEQFVAVVGDAAAGAAERERGTEDDRESDLAGEIDPVFQIVDQGGLGHVEADLASSHL